MEIAFNLIILVLTVVTVGGVARRWNLPGPLLLVLVGIVGSFVPRFDHVSLDPDVVLVGILPPLLYAAAVRTSLLEIRTNLRPILALSVLLVAVTTVGIGYLVWWMLPIPLAAGLALGAVVAPPDAVAASAIARKVGLPRRLVTILEGESLLNDATALVCLHSAIAAITGHVTAGEVTFDFARSAVGGTAVGLLVAVVAAKVRYRVDDSLTDTSISLVTPFAAYLLAEEIHGSGVLAVVVAGLVLGHKAEVIQSASSRMFERTNWRMIEFLLENAVFLIIGLEARTILEAVADSEVDTGRIVLACVAALAGVVVIRGAWMVLAGARVVGRGPRPTGSALAVLSWAGMRGVVTLAAAFVLPSGTPHREVLILVAMVVTAGTLLLQGSTLPLLIRRLGLSGPDRAQDALSAASVYEQAARAGRDRLAEMDLTDVDPEVVERLHQRSTERSNALWERLGGSGETPSEQYARLRRKMLEAEREAVLDVRDTGTVPHEVLAHVLAALDIEESIIEMADRADTDERDEALVARVKDAACEHLAEAPSTAGPTTPDGCEECLAEGRSWVHLRLCLTCGHVGCCDSSPGRHATAHHHESGHPVIRSFEAGEAWRWCFVDEVVG